MRSHQLTVAILALCVFSPRLADGWTLDREASVFAVVTHKEGLAAGLAHEHLVVATDFEAELVADLEHPEASWFELRLAAAGLSIDDPVHTSRWQEHLLELGLVEEPFASLSDKDRAKIRTSMLGRKQLDAESHGSLHARLDGLRPAEAGGWVATLSLTVRGKTAERQVAFQLPEPGAPMRIEVTTTFDFEDFGIEPYSAMLGSIRVANTFHVFARLVASP